MPASSRGYDYPEIGAIEDGVLGGGEIEEFFQEVDLWWREGDTAALAALVDSLSWEIRAKCPGDNILAYLHEFAYAAWWMADFGITDDADSLTRDLTELYERAIAEGVPDSQLYEGLIVLEQEIEKFGGRQALLA